MNHATNTFRTAPAPMPTHRANTFKTPTPRRWAIKQALFDVGIGLMIGAVMAFFYGVYELVHLLTHAGK